MTKADERIARCESDIHHYNVTLNELKNTVKEVQTSVKQLGDLVVEELRLLRSDMDQNYVKKAEITTYKTFAGIVGLFLFISTLITFISKVFPGFIFWK